MARDSFDDESVPLFADTNYAHSSVEIPMSRDLNQRRQRRGCNRRAEPFICPNEVAAREPKLENDSPEAAPRFIQRSIGYKAKIVNGRLACLMVSTLAPARVS
jgi:hypothetical protein